MCRKKARFPTKSATSALHLRRGLAELEIFRVAHAGDQLLLLFTERMKSSVFFKSCITESQFGEVILELLNQSFDGFLAIRVFFLDG